jgi:manganese/zinc/iron transport system ATP- binding protein
VRLDGVSVVLGRRIALRGVDLEIPPGSMVGLLGPNGSGKTSLLRAVAGLVRPRRGRVEIFGRSIAESRPRIAYVAQREDVHWEFPVTVQEVAEMGRYREVGWLRRLRRRDHEDALAALGEVDLLDRRHEQIGHLSGGQQQRAFIARALVQRADLLLLDEPLNGVDAGTQERVIEILRERVAAGSTVLIATHDLETAAHTCDRVVLLNNGRLIAAGPTRATLVAEYLEPTFGGQLHFHESALAAPFIMSAETVHHDATR